MLLYHWLLHQSIKLRISYKFFLNEIFHLFLELDIKREIFVKWWFEQEGITSYNKHFARETADVKAPFTIPTPAVREETPASFISLSSHKREKSETRYVLTNKPPRGYYTKKKWEFECWTNLSDVKSFSFFFFFPFFPLFFPLFFFFWRKQKRFKVCAERTAHCIVQFPSMPCTTAC